MKIKSTLAIGLIVSLSATADYVDTLESCGGHEDHGLAATRGFETHITSTETVISDAVWAKVLEDCAGHTNYGLAVSEGD